MSVTVLTVIKAATAEKAEETCTNCNETMVWKDTLCSRSVVKILFYEIFNFYGC